jgi:hypothetical protein
VNNISVCNFMMKIKVRKEWNMDPRMRIVASKKVYNRKNKWGRNYDE